MFPLLLLFGLVAPPLAARARPARCTRSGRSFVRSLGLRGLGFGGLGFGGLGFVLLLLLLSLFLLLDGPLPLVELASARIVFIITFS